MAQGAVTLQIGSEAEVTCTFVNERPATIRGQVYEDHNRNGRRNSTEPFLADWPLAVYISGTQTLVAEGRTTGTAPLVSFNRLLAGSYTLCVTLPAGWGNSDPATVTQPYNLPCRSLAVLPGQLATVRFGAYQQAVLTAEATAADEPGEESLIYSAEADSQGETSAEDEQWLAEEPVDSGVRRLFLPVASR